MAQEKRDKERKSKGKENNLVKLSTHGGSSWRNELIKNGKLNETLKVTHWAGSNKTESYRCLFSLRLFPQFCLLSASRLSTRQKFNKQHKRSREHKSLVLLFLKYFRLGVFVFVGVCVCVRATSANDLVIREQIDYYVSWWICFVFEISLNFAFAVLFLLTLCLSHSLLSVCSQNAQTAWCVL